MSTKVKRGFLGYSARHISMALLEGKIGPQTGYVTDVDHSALRDTAVELEREVEQLTVEYKDRREGAALQSKALRDIAARLQWELKEVQRELDDYKKTYEDRRIVSQSLQDERDALLAQKPAWTNEGYKNDLNVCRAQLRRDQAELKRLRGQLSNRIPQQIVDGSVSLRDYFAAKAMQSLIAKVPLHDREGSLGVYTPEVCDIHGVRQEIARSSYDYADAMIEVRATIDQAVSNGGADA